MPIADAFLLKCIHHINKQNSSFTCKYVIKSYKIVSAGVVHHPSFFDHSGAPPFGVFDGLNYTHQWDIGAGRGASKRHEKTSDLLRECGSVIKKNSELW